MTAESDLRFFEGRGAGHREVRGTRASDASAPASALEKPQVHGGGVLHRDSATDFPSPPSNTRNPLLLQYGRSCVRRLLLQGAQRAFPHPQAGRPSPAPLTDHNSSDDQNRPGGQCAYRQLDRDVLPQNDWRKRQKLLSVATLSRGLIIEVRNKRLAPLMGADIGEVADATVVTVSSPRPDGIDEGTHANGSRSHTHPPDKLRSTGEVVRPPAAGKDPADHNADHNTSGSKKNLRLAIGAIELLPGLD